MTAALFMAAALTMAQAGTPASPPPPSPSVVAPTAQPVTPAPAAPAAQLSTAPAATQPAAAPGAPPTAQPASGAPVVSTAPQDDLDAPPSVRPYEETPAAAPAGPVPYETADAPVKTPVKVEEYHRSYEGPQDAQETSYEAGVKGAFDAQQALRGRLEGMWIVSAADGAPLLSLVISDPGRPDAPPGGAWRDLSRAHDRDGSGLIDQVVEDGASVTMQIRLKTDAPPATLRLTASADGRWRGQLLDGGKPKPVVMDRKAI